MSPKNKARNFFVDNGIWWGCLALAALLAVLTHGDFLSARNLTNLLRQASINGMLACGMALVILTGGIDLSIGSVVALAGISVGLSEVAQLPLMVSIAAALGVGLASGCVNGILITFLGVPPFVITLGFMVVARGVALILSNGTSIAPMSASLLDLAGSYLPIWPSLIFGAVIAALYAWQFSQKPTKLFLPALFGAFFLYAFWNYRGLPVLAVFALLTAIALDHLLRFTVLGRSIYAIGANARAAYLAGVAVDRTIFFVYACMGALSGAAGLLLTARLNGADPNAGQLFELDAIAAVVIGGTSLKGGSGSILGSVVGALTIATLNNGMDLLGVPSFYQMVGKGLIIITAVSLDRSSARV